MKKFTKYSTLFIIIILSLFILASCAEDEPQEQLPEQKQQVKEPDVKVTVSPEDCGDGTCSSEEEDNNLCPKDCDPNFGEGTGASCGDGTCDDHEEENNLCPKDCDEDWEEPQECEDSEDCDDDELCTDQGFCVEGNAIQDNAEDIFYDMLDDLEDSADALTERFDNLYNYLENHEDDIDEDDYSDIEDNIDTYYEEVEATEEDIKDTIETLYAGVNDVTTATIDDFNQDLEDVRETLNDAWSDVNDNLQVFYADINDDAGIEGSDLFVSYVEFEGIDDDEKEGTFTVTVKNIGNEDVDDSFSVYVRLTIESDIIGSCTEDIDSLDEFEEDDISCDFDIEEYYDMLVDEDEDKLDVEIDIEVDSEDEIEEINEGNNEVEWTQDWTLFTFGLD